MNNNVGLVIITRAPGLGSQKVKINLKFDFYDTLPLNQDQS